MTLKVVIFDESGTLVQPGGLAADGVPEMLCALRRSGLKIAVVSNHSKADASESLRRAGLISDVVIGRDTAGQPKPSPRFCKIAGDAFDAKTSEMIYVGDNDHTDAFCAINAKVLYLSARWANASAKYGLPVDDPASLRRFIGRFLLADPKWYWRLSRRDKLGRRVRVLGLLPMNRNDQASYDLKGVLKFNRALRVEGLDYRAFLFRRLLTAMYLDGMLADIDTWTWYPSHAGEEKHSSFTSFFDQVTRLFRDSHVPSLLVRHQVAVKSATARVKEGRAYFSTQVKSVHLNTEYESKIAGKHVFLVDDFCTEGFSFEWGRNLLYQGGAKEVTCVAFGRYHDEYVIHTPKKRRVWNPWRPVTLGEDDFETETYRGKIDTAALPENTRLLQLKP